MRITTFAAIAAVGTLLSHSSQAATGFGCPEGQTLQDGMNDNWAVADVPRSLHVALPDVSAETPIAVVFSWHGMGDSIENWRRFFAPDPNQPDFPVAIITPHDSGLSPFGRPNGLSWDIFQSVAGDDNREALLFEQVLGCLEKDFRVDTNRIYSIGFSAGAIVSNMLHARYPTLLRAVFSISGAWFNDPDQRGLIPLPIGLDWTPLEDPENSTSAGTVLYTTGGPEDRYAPIIEIMNFERAGDLAWDFLAAHGRTVIRCQHDRGHQPHPSWHQDAIMDFFRSHRGGEVSPYRQPEQARNLPTGCAVHGME